MRYVLGFAFSEDGRVALIRKNRPEKQAGRLNGIGGKIEDMESGYDAMVREFQEETSVSHYDWIFKGSLYGDWGEVVVFSSVLPNDKFSDIITITDEEIEIYPWAEAFYRDDVLSNIPYLLLMCLNNKVENFYIKCT